MTAATDALPLGLRLLYGALDVNTGADDALALRTADEILERAAANKIGSAQHMTFVLNAAEQNPHIPKMSDDVADNDDIAAREAFIAEDAFRIGVAVAWRFMTAMEGGTR